MKIYVDMDGVLSDLDGALCLFGGVSRSVLQNPNLRQSLIQARVSSMGLSHWESLKPLNPGLWDKDLRELRKAGHEIEILTSYGSWDVLEVGPKSHQGKCNWLRAHYSALFAEGVITGFNGVEKCWQKRLFSESGTYLLDDSEENVKGFLLGGGSAWTYSAEKHSEALNEVRKSIEQNTTP